ncbi:monooxygenase [Angustibacter aerolatus]
MPSSADPSARSGEAEAVELLHLWGVRPRQVPAAVARMATSRPALRGTEGLTFRKLLGTGDGRTFTARDADPLHWGLLTVWRGSPYADAFTTSHPAVRSWRRIAHEELVVRMRPIVSRGTWAGREPFGRPVPRRVDGPVASLTRARIRPTRAAAFWRSVPPVSADLHRVDGLRLAVGVGEAPVGLQGTFSLWRDGAALQEFAHGRSAHVDVVRRTPEEGWYAEELFARLQVLSVDGTFGGATP